MDGPQHHTEHRALILVVDDEWLIATGIQTDLIECGYDVAGPAGSVRQALGIIETGQVEGAVLDIQLTGETSFAIALELRCRGIPYMFVTGFSGDQIPAEHGASQLLSKPVDKKQLLNAVRTMMDA
jgi:CheY-like chemotaxis protein